MEVIYLVCIGLFVVGFPLRKEPCLEMKALRLCSHASDTFGLQRYHRRLFEEQEVRMCLKSRRRAPGRMSLDVSGSLRFCGGSCRSEEADGRGTPQIGSALEMISTVKRSITEIRRPPALKE